MNKFLFFVIAGLCVFFLQCHSTPSQEDGNTGDTDTLLSDIPPNMHLVTPVTEKENSPEEPNAASKELRVGQGKFFSFALPDGWQVAEDGQFALTLVAPDRKALTVMVGNSGYPVNYSPAQFVYEKLMSIQPENLQLGQPQKTTPAAGFKYAYQFDVTYTVQGVPCKGVAKCHITPSYDIAVMAMTAALSEAKQWPGYSSWLPLVSEQISATDGAAFGIRGIMQQNLENSKAFGEALQRYREWSQKTWQGVTEQRGRSIDRQNEEFRENIANVQSYTSPYSQDIRVELPNTYKYYWMDKQGRILGTDDPNVDPNVKSGTEWSQMAPYQRR